MAIIGRPNIRLPIQVFRLNIFISETIIVAAWATNATGIKLALIQKTYFFTIRVFTATTIKLFIS